MKQMSELRIDRNIIKLKCGYRVHITINKKKTDFGIYSTLEEAIAVRNNIEDDLKLKANGRITPIVAKEIMRLRKTMTRKEIATRFKLSKRSINDFCSRNKIYCLGEKDPKGGIKIIRGKENRKLLQELNRDNVLCKPWVNTNERT